MAERKKGLTGTLLKTAAAALIAVLLIFIFFPFERLTAEIGRAVSEHLKESGENITYKNLESDFFRCVALSEVVIKLKNGLEEKEIHLNKVILYLRPFFLLRKVRRLTKISLSGSDIDVEKSDKEFL